MSNEQHFYHMLRSAGYRLTPQRRAICNYLAATTTHPTPSAVFDALADEHPGLSRATVYNTLNTLLALGALVQIDLRDGHAHYETNLTPHINLICRQCNRVFDHQPTDLNDVPWANLPAIEQFRAETVHIQVVGLCDDCLSPNNRSRKL